MLNILTMELNLFYFISCIFVLCNATDSSTNKIEIESMQVKDIKLNQCNASADYLLTVTDVNISIGSKPKINFSGSLFSQIDLIGPIQADLWIKRYIFGVWIPVPCEDNIGSCTYRDLCKYGLPLNQSCPNIFNSNNVPCRCPISKGNYTIAPTINLSKETSITSGYYKGTVEITQNSTLLSCYNIRFTLYDALNEDRNNYLVYQV